MSGWSIMYLYMLASINASEPGYFESIFGYTSLESGLGMSGTMSGFFPSSFFSSSSLGDFSSSSLGDSSSSSLGDSSSSSLGDSSSSSLDVTLSGYWISN